MDVPAQHGTVLVLEDDPGIGRLQRLQLERAGYRVELTTDTASARKKLAESRIELLVLDYQLAEPYAKQIESLCGYKTESWQEANANFLKIFRIQTIITYFITGALLVVAAFGVLNILIMAVLERVNDIAILKSFGLSRYDVTLVYVFQGLVIGIIGSIVGLIFGKLGVEALRRVPIQMEGLVKAEGLLMAEHTKHYVMAFVSAIIIALTNAAMYWYACSLISRPSTFTRPSIWIGSRRKPSIVSFPKITPIVEPTRPMTSPWKR